MEEQRNLLTISVPINRLGARADVGRRPYGKPTVNEERDVAVSILCLSVGQLPGKGRKVGARVLDQGENHLTLPMG